MQVSPKYTLALNPALTNNASPTAIAVDLAGSGYAEVIFQLGATDIALTALKLTECDTSGGSYTDVSGSVFATDNTIAAVASVLPTATDDNKVYVWQVNPLKRKRYLKLVATVGNGSTGANISAVVALHKMSITPVVAADRGCAQILRV